MKKTEMLKKNYQIKSVIRYGKFYSGDYLDFFILPNKKNKNFLCVAVTKKTGNSVVRNRIKRKIRENYKIIEEKTLEGYSIVVLWKKKVESEKATFYNIKKDFDFVFKKANILEEK